MEAKEKAKELFEQVKKEGLSTDYSYSPYFYKWCKEKATNRAEKLYPNLFEDIKKEMESI